MKKQFILLAAVFTFNFQLSTFNSFAQANLPGAGNALSFNGTSDYVDCGDRTPFEGMGKITVSGWIYMSATLVGAQLYCPFGKEQCYRITISSGWGITFTVATNNNGWYSLGTVAGGTANTLQPNRWCHIAGVYNGSSVFVYVDGILVGTNSVSISGNIVSNSDFFSIGYKMASNIDYFNGKIDEVRIWNRALTQTEIRDNMCQKLIGSEAGLVGYWRFDETSGTTAYDSQTNVAPNNGTLK